MEVTLNVIHGAKSGAKIPIKKNEFLIGRSETCHLAAGSSAVSRRHCAIYRKDNAVSIKDLGSRNGTLVNGEKTDGEVVLKSGDEITIGPLKFLLTISTGITNEKRSQVKSVAQAVERTAEASHADASDDDISRWLLAPDPSALNETQTIRMDDTNAAQVRESLQDGETTSVHQITDETTPESEESDEEQASDSKIASGKKKEPGKLPKSAKGPTAKDSREAAAQALRNWSRRR